MTQLVLLLIISAFFTVNAQKIDCDFIVHSARGYGCVVQDMENYYVTKIGGKHMPGKSNADVLYFEANSKTLEFIPQGIHKHFPNLKGVKINFENLAEITENDLKPFGDKLNYLSIFTSAIEVIPSNIFASTPNINYMFLSAPHLKSIENGAFDPLQNLQALFVKFPCEDDEAINREKVESLIQTLGIRCHDKNKMFEPKKRPSQNDLSLNDPHETAKNGADVTSKLNEGNSGFGYKASAIVVIFMSISSFLM